MMKLKYLALNNFFGGGATVEPLNTQYVFDGTNDFIDYGNVDYTNGSFSAGCWFKTTDNEFRLIQKRGTGVIGTLNGWSIGKGSGHTNWANILMDQSNGN